MVMVFVILNVVTHTKFKTLANITGTDRATPCVIETTNLHLIKFSKISCVCTWLCVCAGRVLELSSSSLCWTFTCLGSVRLWTRSAPPLHVVQTLPLPARSQQAVLLLLQDQGDWRRLVWLVSVWRTLVWLLWGSSTCCWPTVMRWWNNNDKTETCHEQTASVRGISVPTIFTPLQKCAFTPLFNLLRLSFLKSQLRCC